MQSYLAPNSLFINALVIGTLKRYFPELNRFLPNEEQEKTLCELADKFLDKSIKVEKYISEIEAFFKKVDKNIVFVDQIKEQITMRLAFSGLNSPEIKASTRNMKESTKEPVKKTIKEGLSSEAINRMDGLVFYKQMDQIEKLLEYQVKELYEDGFGKNDIDAYLKSRVAIFLKNAYTKGNIS